MSSPRKSLFLDLARLRAASEHIATAADCISTMARRLRLPIASPAPDAVTVYITSRCNFYRRELGAAGEAASDELVRAAEYILAGAYTLATIATRTQMAIIGLRLPTVNPEIIITGPAVRATAGEAPPSAPSFTTDDDVLGFATLLAAGNPDLRCHLQTDTAALNDAREALRLAIGLLPEAMSNAERPVAFLERCVAWIGEYSEAISSLDASVSEWNEKYVQIRVQTNVVVGQYITKLASAIRGDVEVVNPSAPWAAYREYSAIVMGPVACARFPCLAKGQVAQ